MKKSQKKNSILPIELIPLDEFISTILYYLSERDDRGLLQGELTPRIDEETGLPIWRGYVWDGSKHLHWLRGDSPSGYLETHSLERPKDDGPIKWKLSETEGVGKPLQLEAARRAAGLPNATIEELSDVEALEARYYELLAEIEDQGKETSSL